MTLTLSQRSAHYTPSPIRELLNLTEQPGMISLAGGLPAPESFPVQALRAACVDVLDTQAQGALQYGPSEGIAPLREWVAAHLRAQGIEAQADEVLITSGSQQGLDLVGRVLIDPGSTVLVERPTYLGALQAFAPYGPRFADLDEDAGGALPTLDDPAHGGARMVYLQPNFRNPTGQTMTAARRTQWARALRGRPIALVEDNPYGDLWFDGPPPAPVAAQLPGQSLVLGTFSKVLSPGLRLGYVHGPHEVIAKMALARQAADLQTSSLTQRLVLKVLEGGLLDVQLPHIRALYRAQRDAMLAALSRHMPGSVHWETPQGGMFIWLSLPQDADATALLPLALQRKVAYVPGTAFYAAGAVPRNTLRLSYATATPAQIETAIARLGEVFSATHPPEPRHDTSVLTA
ncbi:MULTISPECIES: PLP-dependent aminotransferase family protein [unclassified Thiomonas]|uniref:aminotransferase-like domain-containing protein n=1 Tax=unclassified Thiomonas TaxID=2625466 RepID=UPI0004DBA0D6|nr:MULTISPECIES: PLP-dependent aminotransferase family protein [unclassified Thiomonas]MDD4999799.1 PLP-dependent aminotransferase family protein [Thiomonas arsenitoxydans]CQR43291.1 2-aminoadipate transaminase [Thiomonas sp. CB3]CDW93943.1 2-aminoadipate transaminase [Thiomonas sp. CB2]VDY04684.1 2-aminoadipate transaminase [Thiomonas sp. Bio17B3]VDY08143.1 2-aminoadipate transaminase [Thiomonas sp. Sup16B3]